MWGRMRTDRRCWAYVRVRATEKGKADEEKGHRQQPSLWAGSTANGAEKTGRRLPPVLTLG